MLASHYEHELIHNQPSTLNYINLGSVCSLATMPRMIFDDETGDTSYWGANMPIEEKLKSIFLNMQRKDYCEHIASVDLFPVIYHVNQEEKDSMKGVLEIEGKDVLSGSLLIYKAYKTKAEDISFTRLTPAQIDACSVVYYGLFLEQTIDDEELSTINLVSALINTGLKQHRRIPYVPHESIPLTVHLSEEIVNKIAAESRSANIGEYSSFTEKTYYAIDELKTKSKDAFLLVNPVEKINGEFIGESLTETVSDYNNENQQYKLPIIYNEVWQSYVRSFDKNRYRIL